MSSFLNRNIALNLFYSNSRNYSDKKVSPFSSFVRISNTLEKDHSSKSLFSANDKTIHYIFKIIYYKEFPNILTNNSKIFLRNVNTKAEELIKKNITQNIYSTQEVKSFISISKEKILNLYNEEFSFLKESFLNYEKNPKKYEILRDNTLIHCIKSYGKNIYHKCGIGKYGNFISINKKKDNIYIICIKCKKCYKNNYINLYCNICNKEYYGLLYRKIDLNTSSDKDLYLATWKRYHCGLINNEIMKCINCKNYFYYNIKTDKLICENRNCDFISNPEYIIWKCSKCLKDFISNVKPYNANEFRIFKQELYYIILNKIKAKPNKIIRCLNCKKFINGDNKLLFHHGDCKGELYTGKLCDKNILVCNKCFYSNYFEEFIWICPFCKKEITKKNEDKNNNKNKNKKDITTNTNNNKDNKIVKNDSGNEICSNISDNYFRQRISYNKIRSMRRYLQKQKGTENENILKNTNTFMNKNNNKPLNINTMKTLSNDFNSGSTRKNLRFRTLEKDYIISTDKNITTEIESHNFSLTKNNLNNSNNNSLLSLQNKDHKAFHSIIMKMKNRMISSKNKDKYFNQNEKNIKNENDNDNNNKNNNKKNNENVTNKENKKNMFFRKLHLPNHFMSYSIEIDKKEFLNDIKTIENEKKTKMIRIKYNNQTENKNVKKIENNNKISVKKDFSRKNSGKKFNKENKISEIKSNRIITPKRELKGLRSKYKENKNTINNDNNTSTRKHIYIKEKTTKMGYFYKKINNENNKKIKYENNINGRSKYNIKENNTNNTLNKKISNKNNIKENIEKNIYKKEDNDTQRHKFNKSMIYKRKNNEKIIKGLNEKNSNEYNNKNDNKFIKINNYNNTDKNKNRIQFNINNNKNENEQNKKDKNNDINDIPQENHYKKINNYFSKKRTLQNTINISGGCSPENDGNNKKVNTTNEREKSENTNKLINFKMVNKFRYFRKNKDEDNQNENEKKNNNPYSYKTFNKSKNNLIDKTENKNTLSNLIKKNLEEFYDNKNDDNNFAYKKGKSESMDIYSRNKLQNINKYNDNIELEKENKDQISKESNEVINNNNYFDILNLYEEDEEDEEEEKNDIINELNIKKVIQHFAHRKSVVKILREIGNEDNSKNKEKIQDNHFVLEGLINHVNLISSPEKITLLEKNSKIPIFSDDDYIYYESLGEGANANVYLVKDKNTNEEFALKKMVCQDFNDLEKIKNKLEIINSLNHDNIMKVHKIQFKCLDFTTYAINTIMDKAITDWNYEIGQRSKNKNYYTEKELLNIAKQVIDGLAFLQENNIAHRDIKPQNILIFPKNIYKIADLGEMREDIPNMSNIKRQFTIKGSASFLSPALKNGLEHNKSEVKHNVYKSDVFSLGYCFLYAMGLNMDILEQAREYWGGNKDNKTIDIDIQKYIGKNRYSEQFVDFIGKMIVEDENKREDFLGLQNELKFLKY